MRDKLLTRTDTAALLLLTACAAVMAFAGLGSLDAPHSYWSTTREGEAAVADAGTVVEVDRISYWVGLGAGACAVELSRDGLAWERAGLIEQPDRFGYIEWRVMPAGAAVRYLRLVVLKPGLEIGEIGAFGPEGSRVPLTGVEGPVEPFDEQAVVVRTPTARTGMYFDETYFARSAWEQLRGLEPVETSHPPLGRTIVSLGIALWGMNPFGWRFMGALAGVLTVPLLYLVARRLFDRTRWAIDAGMLFTVDFLRFAQSRMATVDVFVLLFTLLAFAFVLEHGRSTRPWPWLVGAGLALGAGLAVKWSAAFPALGVAVLAAAAELRRIHGARRKAGATAVATAGAVGRGIVCLALVPLAVYAAGWLPWIIGRGATLSDVIARHVAMYRYHSTIGETRWYASVWWQWPLDIRPIWLYRGTVDVVADRVASVVAMGNPATWWVGAAAVPAVAVIGILKRDRIASWILVALACSWLPWAFSARTLTFIYHFLPVVPFLVLGLVYSVGNMVERFPRARPVAVAFAAVPIIVFAVFLPLLTGIPVPRVYAEALRWLSTWIFFA